MRTFSAGIMKRIRTLVWRRIQNPKEEKFNSVMFWDIIPIFVIWASGLLLAVVFLFTEIVYCKMFKINSLRQKPFKLRLASSSKNKILKIIKKKPTRFNSTLDFHRFKIL